jgi:hypothetical protein
MQINAKKLLECPVGCRGAIGYFSHASPDGSAFWKRWQSIVTTDFGVGVSPVRRKQPAHCVAAKKA